VVGREQPAAHHIPELTYTRMVFNEVLRLYPPAWIMPRSVVAPDNVDGVRIGAGATVVISPFLTHRMADYWDNPTAFDPQRFSPEHEERRHRYAFYPFSGGAHQCLGAQLVTVEAQLIIATMLSRFRAHLRNQRPVRPQAAVTLRPRGQVALALSPVDS
jgi:cytochrome P450